jgi:hypothetical protein
MIAIATSAMPVDLGQSLSVETCRQNHVAGNRRAKQRRDVLRFVSGKTAAYFGNKEFQVRARAGKGKEGRYLLADLRER